MPIGVTLLGILTVLILFGVMQRILDRMRLTDKQALFIVISIIAFSFLEDIPITNTISFSIAGALIPLALCVYLFISAGTAKERWRAIGATLLSALAVILISRLLPAEPEAMPFDPYYIYGPVAGVIAYLMGRSRRSAFIAGITGVLLADTLIFVYYRITGVPSVLRLGSSGAFDAVVISGLLAVLMAELIGEAREKIAGGKTKNDLAFEGGKFVERNGGEH